jgi:hypothetical protein
MEHLKIIRFSSSYDCQDLLGRRLVVRVVTSKGSTISHMAAVHPGHSLPGALQKEEEVSTALRWQLSIILNIQL